MLYYLSKFQSMVERRGDMVAVRDGEREISRRDFAQLTEQIGSALQKLVTRPLIAIDIPKSIESIAVIVACMRRNIAFIPLNAHWPTEKKRRIIKVARPEAVINLKTNGELDVEQRSFSELLQQGELEDAASAAPFPDNRIAYIIFTSGSTGEPKGVPISMSALEAFATNIEGLLQLEEDKEELLHLPAQSFDISLQDILLFLLGKGPLTTLDARSNPLKVVEVVDAHRITYLSSVGNTFTLLLGYQQWLKPENLGSLTTACSGGSTLFTSTARDWLARFPGARLFNLFGPTEATIYFCGTRVTEEDLTNEPSVHIGTPFSGQGILYKEGEEFTDSPSGEAELYLYGSQLMEGYVGSERSGLETIEWNGSSMTAYPTGDIFRKIDGRHYFQYRRAGFFKSGGYRVSPQEIEQAYLEMDGIIETAVVGQPDPVKENLIVLFYAAEEDVSEQAFVDFGKSRLAAYSIPHQYIRLENIPKTTAQKTDYLSLKQRL